VVAKEALSSLSNLFRLSTILTLISSVKDPLKLCLFQVLKSGLEDWGRSGVGLVRKQKALCGSEASSEVAFNIPSININGSAVIPSTCFSWNVIIENHWLICI
jgi:hypothetical protein